MQLFTGKAWHRRQGGETDITREEYIEKGKQLLDEKNPVVHELEIIAEGFENARRKTVITKIQKAYTLFKEMIVYYGCNHLVALAEDNNVTSLAGLVALISSEDFTRQSWLNVGGQLIPTDTVNAFRKEVREGGITSWDGVHAWYQQQGAHYARQKTLHALASLQEVTGINLRELDISVWQTLLDVTVNTKEWITNAIYTSRAKDYANPYRKMVYDNEKEMEKVTGSLDGNNFIKMQQQELEDFSVKIAGLKERIK
jgi:hypothetical protein